MRRLALSLLVLGLLAGLHTWSARAGDESGAGPGAGKSVEERLAAIEQRLTVLEEKTRPLDALAPALAKARPLANEAAAIATLRNVVSAQAQLQASGRVDEDQDGVGEYGGFLELAGALKGRMGSLLDPQVLPSSFRQLQTNGAVSRSGYYFRLFLPGKGGTGVGEPLTGYAKGLVDVDLCETKWCCYAWPVEPSETTTRTFVATQEGDVLAARAKAYGGLEGCPKPDAAFKDAGRIDGALAAGSRGSDGNVWTTVD